MCYTQTEILQIKVGKLCNLTCITPTLAKNDILTVDLTGRAPEMIPDF